MTALNIPPAVASSSASPPALPGVSPGRSAVGLENQQAKESLLPPIEQVEKNNEVSRHEDRFTRSSQETAQSTSLAEKNTSTQEQYVEVGVKAQRLDRHAESHTLAVELQQESLAAAEFETELSKELALERDLESRSPVTNVPQGGDPELQLRALEQIQYEAKNSIDVNVDQQLAAAQAAKQAEALRAELAQRAESALAETAAKEEAVSSDAQATSDNENLDSVPLVSEEDAKAGLEKTELALPDSKGFSFEQSQFNAQQINEVSSQLLKYQNQQVPEFDIQKTISQLV